ncbi:MAG: hypothetical protein HY303_11275, partial [Candidatus Wallbacteria bacterium]|nr:hypothetical protein [Candidatus Wallbacteria bacterium]
LSLAPGSGTLTAENRVRFSGSVLDATPTLVTVRVPGTTLSAQVLVSPPFPSFSLELGPLPFLPPATLGGLSLDALATDLAGNATDTQRRPLAVDTDGDGLPDWFEARATLARDGVSSTTGLDPRADDDGDGLTNLQEFLAGTDPELADSDDDGMSDSVELAQARRAPGSANPLDASDSRPVAALAKTPPARMAPQVVALDGRASRDPRGRPLGYRWSLLTSPADLAPSPFLGASASSALAFARLTAAGQYQFLLTVGNGSAFRSPPSTTVTVNVSDVAPRAAVGPAQVFEAAGFPLLTRLDASASADDNAPSTLAYSWRLAVNPNSGAQLEGDLASASPFLRVFLPGAYGVEVSVSSPPAPGSAVLTSIATAVVIVAGPLPPAAPPGQGPTTFAPVARAGFRQRVVTIGTETFVDVPLAGRDSVDPNSPATSALRPSLDFFWSQLSGPEPAVLLPDARGALEGSAQRSVDPRARLFAPGRYFFGLQVVRAASGQPPGVGDAVEVEWVRLPAAQRLAPLADAGLGRVISDFDAAAPPVVELNGSGSRPDPRLGGTLTYEWSQHPGEYRYQLVVTDSNGISSLPATVPVLVRPRTRAAFPKVTVRALDAAGTPLSFANPARIQAGPTFPVLTLSGTAVARGTLAYRWRQLFDGSTAAPVTLHNDTRSAATFRPTVSGTYRFAMTVSDSVLSAEAIVAVPVDDLRPGGNAGVTPVVRAPASVEVAADRDGSVTLDGSASFDRDGSLRGRRASPLTYLWRQTAGPSVLAFDRTAAKPSLTLPAGTFGRYSFECVLDDGQDAVLSDELGFSAVPQTAASAADPRLASGNSAAGAERPTTSTLGGCQMAPATRSGSSLSWVLLVLSMLWIAIMGRRRADKRHYIGPKRLVEVALLAGALALPGAARAQNPLVLTGTVQDEGGTLRNGVSIRVDQQSFPFDSKTSVTAGGGRWGALPFTNVTTGSSFVYSAAIRGLAVDSAALVPNALTVSAADQSAGRHVETMTIGGPVTSISHDNASRTLRDGSHVSTISFGRAVQISSVSIDISPVESPVGDISIVPDFTPGDTVATLRFDVPAATANGPARVRIQASGLADKKLPALVFDQTDDITIDTVAPTVASLTSSVAGPVGTGPTTIAATFTEAMATAPVLHFRSPAGHPSFSQAMLTADPARKVWSLPYVVLSSPELPAGTVDVSLESGADLAGNPLDVSAALTTTFVFDNRRPRGSLSASAHCFRTPQGVLAGGFPATFTLIADEPLDVNFPPLLALNQSGGLRPAPRPMSPTGFAPTATTWTLVTPVFAQNTAAGVVDGPATVTLAGGRDLAGNQAVLEPVPSFVVDSIGPVVSIAYNGKTTTATVTAGALHILAVISDSTTVTAPNVLIVPNLPDGGPSFGAMTKVTTNTFVFDTLLRPRDGNTAFPLPDGNPITYTVQLTAADSFGQLNDSVCLPPSALFNGSFVADTRPYTLTFEREPSTTRVGSCPMVLTATFPSGRPVTAPPSILVTSTSDATSPLPLTTMATVVPGFVYTSAISATASRDTTYRVTIAGPRGEAFGGFSDSAGNTATFITTFAVDPTPPAVRLSFSQPGAPTVAPSGSLLRFSAGPVAITATFSEPVTPATTAFLSTSNCYPVPADRASNAIFLSADGPGKANDDAALKLQPTLDPRVWTTGAYNIAQATPTSTSDGLIVFGVNGAADLAGNLNLPVDITTAAIVADTLTPTVTFRFRRTALPFTGSSLVLGTRNPVEMIVSFSQAVTASAPIVTAAGTVTPSSALPGPTALAPLGDDRSFSVGLDGAVEADLTLTVSGVKNLAGKSLAPSSVSTRFDGLGPSCRLDYPTRTDSVVLAGPLPVTATFSEPLRAVPNLAIVRSGTAPRGVNSRPPTAMVTTPDPLVYALTLQILPGDDGVFLLDVTDAADRAGNLLRATDRRTFTIDTAAPDVVVTGSPSLTRPIGRVALTLTARFSEPLSISPTLSISSRRAGSTTNTIARDIWDGTSDPKVFVKTLARFLPGNDGLFDISVDNVVDLAGNRRPRSVVSTFRIDTTSPVASVAFSKSTTVPLRAGTYGVTITFSEPVSPIPTQAIVRRSFTDGQRDTLVPLLPDAAARIFVGSLTIPATSPANLTPAAAGDPAVLLFQAQLVDAAGNAAVTTAGVDVSGRLASFAIDTMPPELRLLPVVSGASAREGGRLTTFEAFTVRPDPLSSAPVLQIVAPGQRRLRVGRLVLDASRTTATTGIDLAPHNPPDDVDGKYNCTLTGGADLAGNPAVFRPGPTVDVLVDTRQPELELLATSDGTLVSADRLNAVTTGRLVVSGTVTDATTTTVTVSLGRTSITTRGAVLQSRPDQQRLSQLSTLQFRAELTVSFPDCAGTTPAALVEAVAVDAAGNSSTRIVRRVVFDQDGDGIPDWFECQTTRSPGGPPASPTALVSDRDDDGDGLLNIQEYQLGTNPRNADTDGDGVSDGVEVQAGSNPRDPRSVPATPPPGITPGVPLAATAKTPSPVVAPQRVALQGAANVAASSVLFDWSVVSAPGAAAAAILADPVFLATRAKPQCFPNLTVPGLYTFRLTAAGLGTAPAGPATADVAIAVLDVPPVARISPATSPVFVPVSEGSTVRAFSAVDSFDPNGDSVSFTWGALDGNSTVPSAAGVPGLGFTSPITGPQVSVEIRQPGDFRLVLTASSTAPGAASMTSTASVRILASGAGPTVPVARAGLDRKVVISNAVVDAVVPLFGHDSFDPDLTVADPLHRTLVFGWKQLAGPGLGSAPFLADARGRLEGDGARSVDPSVRLTAPGRYVFGLTVARAGTTASVSLPDEVTVEVVQIRNPGMPYPAAAAGASRVVAAFDPANPVSLQLDGTDSIGFDDPPASLRFSWRQLRLSDDDPVPAVALSDPASSRPSFVPPESGDYNFELVVTDRLGQQSLPARVRVRVVNAPGVTAGNGATGIQITRAEAVAADSLGRVQRVLFDSPASLTGPTPPAIQLQAAAATTGQGPAPSFRWRQLREGSTAPDVALQGASTDTARFTALHGGNYRFQLEASSGAFSATAIVDVPVDDRRDGGNSGVTPRVTAPARVLVQNGLAARVRLDASASFDRDRDVPGRSAGELTYVWSQVAGPVRLVFDANAAALDLNVPASPVGDYAFEVALDDGQDMVTSSAAFSTFDAAPLQPALALPTGTTRAAVPAGSSGCGLGSGAAPAALPDLLFLAGILGLTLARWPTRRPS